MDAGARRGALTVPRPRSHFWQASRDRRARPRRSARVTARTVARDAAQTRVRDLSLPRAPRAQDVPTNSLGKLHSGAEVHLKCAGAYVTLDSEETYLKWDVTAGAGTAGAEPGPVGGGDVPGDRRATRVYAQHGVSRCSGARRARRAPICVGGPRARRPTPATTRARMTDFVIQSVSTGKYVTVGGMFRGYCLMATADSADEACSFSYVLPGRRCVCRACSRRARRRARWPTPKPAPPRRRSEETRVESTRERRAAALLFSIFVSEGVGAGRQGIVSIRKDGYLTVVDPPKALTAPLLPEDFESTADGPHNERTATPGVAAAAIPWRSIDAGVARRRCRGVARDDIARDGMSRTAHVRRAAETARARAARARADDSFTSALARASRYYELAFREPQLGLIVSRDMPLRVLGFKARANISLVAC